MPSLPEITYITGLSVLTSDAEGSEHDIVIQVKDPHRLDSACPGRVSPCLADGSLSVLLDGTEELRAPGTVSLGKDVVVSAANLPGACRSFGFETWVLGPRGILTESFMSRTSGVLCLLRSHYCGFIFVVELFCAR